MNRKRKNYKRMKERQKPKVNKLIWKKERINNENIERNKKGMNKKLIKRKKKWIKETKKQKSE